MKYTVSEKELIPRGYTFQKLYAADYKTYRKEIGERKIWLWVSGKSIEIDDWFDNTENLINFYKDNIDNEGFKELRHNGEEKGYIKVQMNPKTGYIQFYDYEEYYKVFLKKNVKTAWDDWNNKYKGWRNEIILFKDQMDALIKEIEWLTKKKI